MYHRYTVPGAPLHPPPHFFRDTTVTIMRVGPDMSSKGDRVGRTGSSLPLLAQLTYPATGIL